MAIKLRPIAVLAEKIIEEHGTGKMALRKFVSEVKKTPEILNDFFDYWQSTDGKRFMESQKESRQIIDRIYPENHN